MLKHLRSGDIATSLEGANRQYLVGDLEWAQALAHFDDDNIEIGITSYKEYSVAQPHWHPVACEYQYMISGQTKCLDLESGEETQYDMGDFYCVEPNTKYVQKSLAGTTILFIKTPAGNDKIVLPQSPELLAWLQDWEAVYCVGR